MPKPLSSFTEATHIYSGNNGFSSLAERPHVALLAMQAIKSSSNVEGFMLRLFIQLFGGSEALAASVFLALASNGPKAAAIAAAATVVLNPNETLILAALQKIDKTNKLTRDSIAHHTWGHCDQLPDALLLIDPRATVTDAATDRDNTLVYDENDFRALIKANQKLCSLVMQFSHAFRERDVVERTSKFGELLASPEIQERLPRQAQQA